VVVVEEELLDLSSSYAAASASTSATLGTRKMKKKNLQKNQNQCKSKLLNMKWWQRLQPPLRLSNSPLTWDQCKVATKWVEEE